MTSRKKTMRWLLATIFIIGIIGFRQAKAQSDLYEFPPHGWQLMDYQQDSVYGTDVTKAYNELLKGKKSHTVIVGVIDGGVDTGQEDLKGHIWINPWEIPGNGIDDDHNGYVDDIHGWNFIGGKDGKNIHAESDEFSREYYRLHKIYGNITDSSQVRKKDRKQYRYWLKLKSKREADSAQNEMTYVTVSKALETFSEIDSVLEQATHKDTVYSKDATDIIPSDSVTDRAKEIAMRVFSRIGPDMSFEEFISQGKDYLKETKEKLDDLDVDPNAQRREIVGDNPFDIKDTNYGNNDVDGGDPVHGTHVSGIIAATRNNGIGMNGIANNVIIMPVRVVPDGDERDKDVALGIRYAVNNGAEIINMSFGKGYSPQKKWVDKAIKYAERKGVLLVHAAGNESADDDTVPNFPNPDFLGSNKRADNFINVGASTSGPDSMVVADFSNYGKKEVDLFAPGVDIYSTVPGNKYETLSGTSMASPVVSGIAALVLEYYPTLSAKQLRYVLDNSVMKLPGDSVTIPGTDQRALFSSLSSSGGIVNAYNALKLAATIKGDRHIPRKIRKKQEAAIALIEKNNSN
jgi:cell wall-associated protease